MFLSLFFVGLFVFQVVLYIKALDKKQYKDFRNLFVVEILSFVIIFSCYSYFFKYINLEVYDVISLLISFPLSLFGYVIFLIISIITRLIVSKSLLNFEKNNELKKYVLTITIVFILVLALSCGPKYLKEKKIENKANEVISYLNSRYGDGNFEVVDKQKGCIGQFICDKNSYHYYLFTVKSNYLDSSFTVEVDSDNGNIVKDSFLSTYIKERNYIEDTSADNFIEIYIEEEKKDLITHKDEYEVSLSVEKNNYKFYKEEYGKVPTFEEILEMFDINLYNFKINKILESDEEFKKIIIDIYKDYAEHYKPYNKEDKIVVKYKVKDNVIHYKNIGYIDKECIINEDNNNIYVNYDEKQIVVSKAEIFN